MDCDRHTKAFLFFSFRVRIIENNSKEIQSQIDEMRQLRAEYDKKEVKLCASTRQLWRPIPGAASPHLLHSPISGNPQRVQLAVSYTNSKHFFTKKNCIIC